MSKPSVVVTLADLEAEIARASGQPEAPAPASPPTVRVVFPKWFMTAMLSMAGIHGYSAMPGTPSKPAPAAESFVRPNAPGLGGAALDPFAHCKDPGGCPESHAWQLLCRRNW